MFVQSDELPDGFVSIQLNNEETEAIMDALLTHSAALNAIIANGGLPDSRDAVAKLARTDALVAEWRSF